MPAEKETDEIELADAISLVNSNKSVFVWIGGGTDTPLSDLLEVSREKVIDAEAYDLMDKDKYPQRLREVEKPIFVCHHGVASYVLVKQLESSMNIKGYSLVGGIEGIKSRA